MVGKTHKEMLENVGLDAKNFEIDSQIIVLREMINHIEHKISSLQWQKELINKESEAIDDG